MISEVGSAHPISQPRAGRGNALNGNWGRILKVDLAGGGMEDWEIREDLYRDFIGGSGLAARLFFQLEGYKAEPLSPWNPLFFLNGPISGTTLPGSSRLEVCARSPLTGTWGEASMGGWVSPDLRGPATTVSSSLEPRTKRSTFT